MTDREPTPVFFHPVQLEFKPLYEWAFGERIAHPESTARAESIVGALEGDPDTFALRAPEAIPDATLRRLHRYELITVYNTAAQLPDGETFYPSVFPKREQTRPDPTNMQHAGYYCFDSGTPLNARTLEAASWSAACAHAAARALVADERRLTYALSRPPGHHATRGLFGGYCYFNNAAVAARTLRRRGRVAILDIDFHHGNGTQEIFYEDPNVLVVSIHGDPRDFYPYFAGYAEETGARRGAGFNMNLPLPGGCDGAGYGEALRRHALPAIRHFAPEFLVVSAGLDTYVGDPVGHFALEADDFEALGERIGRLRLPTVVVQEGGYDSTNLGGLVRRFLLGMRAGGRRSRRRRAVD